MAAGVVLMQQVHDIDRYRDEYLPGLRPLLWKPGADVPVAGLGAVPAEGEPPNSREASGRLTAGLAAR